MYVTVITPPEPIVTWEDAKAHLRLDGDDEQTLVTSLVAAATGWIDGPGGWLGRSLGAQTLEARFDAFCGDEVRLPYGPIISPVTSIKYLDDAGDEQTLAAGNYQLLTNGRIVLTTDGEWPSLFTHDEAVRVRYQAGYATVPATIKAAILLTVGHLFNNRESVITGTIATALPLSAEALLAPFRVWSV